MGDMVAEAAALIEGLGARGAVFLGLSIGGVVVMGLASERPDLIRGAILCCTAAKIGTPPLWEERARIAETEGVAALAPAILERWFPPAFRAARPDVVAHWGARLAAANGAGYAGCCRALAETDLRDALPGLRVPVLAVAGGADGSIPPDLARETAAAIPGARFRILPGAGHLPCVDAPEGLAAEIAGFLDALPSWPPGPPAPPRLR
jgi:3-oxoadipate enol-lactonase